MAGKPIFEENIPPQADSLFLLGHLLADYNAKGLFVEDLSQSAIFSQVIGKWTINPQDLLSSPITVASAGKQFSNIELTIAAPLKVALLGGYINYTSLLIDPLYPGFTQTLLNDYFSGVAILSSSPALEPFHFTPILHMLGYEIQFSGKEIELLNVAYEGPLKELSRQEILVTTLLLLLLEIDIRPWIKVGEKTYPQSTIFRIMGVILRKDHLKEPTFTGFLPRLFGVKSPQDRFGDLLEEQPFIAQLVIGVIANYIESPIQEKNIGERTALLNAVRKVFGISDKAVEIDKLRFLETLCEGLAQLAKKAETDGNLYESVNLMQTAQMIIQWLATSPKGAQMRLNRIAVKEGQFGWRILSMHQITSIDLFMSICAYANSASLTDLLYFKQAQELFKKGKHSNLLWSSLMRSIDRGRWILHLMNEFRRSPMWSKDIEEPFEVIFSRMIKQFGQSLYLHLTAAQLTFEKEITSSIAQCWLTEEGQEAFLLKKELKQTNLLLEAHSKEGLSEHTFSLFKDLLLINTIVEPPLQAAVTDPEQQLKEFNELVDRYHAKEGNLLESFLRLLTSTQDVGMQNYCAILIMLLATKEKQWDLAVGMITYLYDTIPQAWDLPGIPIRYFGGYMGEEILKIDRIIDALRTLGEQLPSEQVIHGLLDRYLERYVAE